MQVKFVDIDGKVYRADSCIPLTNAWNSKEIELETLARANYPGKKLQANELVGIKSIGYWNAVKAQQWGLDWHRNEGIEICFLETGSLQLNMNNEKYAINPKDLSITRPWLSHKLGNPNIGPCKLHWIIIDVGVRYPHQKWKWPGWIILNKKDLDELTTYLRQNENPVWRVPKEIENCFIQIGNIVKKEENYESKLKIYLNTLLALLLDLFQKGEVELNKSLIETKRTVELFLKDLDDNLIEPWNLDSMAHHCKLGITQFSKYCREITNSSPMAHLNQLRIKKAERLLTKYPKLSVAEIAYQLGFSSPQYLASVFKKQHKCVPSQFRRDKR